MDEPTPVTVVETPPLEASPPPGAPEAGATTNPFALTFLVLAAPGEAFRGIRDSKWTWIWPLFLLLFTTLASQTIFWYRADVGTFMREQAKHSKMSSAQNMDQAVAQMEKMPRWGLALLMGASPNCVMFVLFFLAAFIYWLCFMAMGDSLKFTGALQAVAWCSLPLTAKNLVACAIVFIKDPANLVDPNNVVMSNLSAIMGIDALPGWAFALLSTLDIFAIWKLVLYIIAFPILARSTTAKASAIVIGLFLLGATIATAMGAFFIR